MESIYYVISWLCHRRCAHCYDDRFRLYVRDELARVVDEAETSWMRIADNLPDSMIYKDMARPLDEGGFAAGVGQYLPTLFAGGGRFATLTTDAVSLAAIGNRRVIGVYALLQMALPFLAFALAAAVPAILFRRRRGLSVTA